MSNNSNKNYKDNMVKIENIKKKYILIQTYTGFGNKIFDCIVGMYLKINFGYHVYYVDTVSHHTKSGDYPMKEIFPKISDNFEIINDNQGDYIKFILNYNLIRIETDSIKKLKDYLVEDNVFLLTTSIYNLVYEMFDSFDKKTKDIFIVNENLIKTDIVSYSNTNYATIHIRYGDKLFLGLKKKNQNNNKFINFPIYTPEYYYEQIKIIKKLKLPIIILTDSPKIIKHFLLDKYNISNDPDIFLPELPFLDSFYLMLKSNYLVLSHSTFSYSAYLLGKSNYLTNKKPVYTFCTIKEFKKKYNPYDLFISNDWIIYQNPKFILNFNQKLIYKMFKYGRQN